MSDIKWFHTQLKEAVDNNKLTIKGFCEEVDLNYLKILKVIRGQALLEQEDLNRIKKSNCFSEEEIRGLDEAFEYTQISQAERQQIESIIRVLKSIYETVIEKNSFGHGLYENVHTSNLKNRMALEINDQIYKGYTYALKEAFLKGKSSFEFILFLPEMPEIINEVFHTVKAMMACLDKRVDWHIKCILLKPGEKESKETDQMVSLSKYIKLAALSKCVEIFLLDTKEKNKIKYGVYFENRTLFLNQVSQGFILEYKDKRENFSHLKYEKNNVFEMYYDRSAFNSYVKETVESNGFLKYNQYSIRSYLSVVSTGDTFKENQTKHDDLAFAPIEIYLEKEKEILQSKKISMVQYICESGVEQVLKTGIVPDYSISSYTLNDLERLSLVYDGLVKVSLGYDLRLLPKNIKVEYPFLDIINFFELHKKNNQWILARSIPANEYLNRKGVADSDFMYGIVVKEPYLVKSFELFCKHIVNYCSMDTISSVNRIKSLVVKHYGRHTEENVKKLVHRIEAFKL